ncbi:MAG: helix-turn-helix transcriptional regulator [Alphaproteobacteria bacterium]|nr:helix-turn-helix transcriptional regulator [Alphaproteobacteria bacterium]
MCCQQSKSQLDLFAPLDFTNKQARHDYERQVNQQVGNLIRTLRRKHGITQKQLGEMLGVTYQQIQKYEAGRSGISVGCFNLILKVLMMC